MEEGETERACVRASVRSHNRSEMLICRSFECVCVQDFLTGSVFRCCCVGGESNQPARSELSCSTCLEESQRNAAGGGGRERGGTASAR